MLLEERDDPGCASFALASWHAARIGSRRTTRPVSPRARQEGGPASDKPYSCELLGCAAHPHVPAAEAATTGQDRDISGGLP